jgi:hypothetical protein
MSETRIETTDFNQTLLLNKIICLIIYGNFALTLEQINKTRQFAKDSSEIEKVSFQNVREFFGPTGFFLDCLVSFFLDLENSLNQKSYKKKDLLSFISLFIFFSYIQEKLLQKFDKNIIFQILILPILFIFLILCKGYFKIAILSITNEYKDSKKNQAMIILGSICLSAFLIYFNSRMEKLGMLKDGSFSAFFLASIMSLFCYSIFFEIFIYRIFLNEKINKIEKKIKNLSWNFFSKDSEEKGEKELTLIGKIAYLAFLTSLSVFFCGVLFFFEKYADILFTQKFGIANEFFFLNAKEIILSLISFILIYSGDNLGGVILEVTKDLSIKNLKNEGIDKKDAKNNFIFHFISYVLIAPILLAANLILGITIFSKILNRENFLTKSFDSIFNLNARSLTIFMTCMFIFANICVGILSFLSAEMQNNARIYIHEKNKSPNLENSEKSFFSIDYWIESCSSGKILLQPV